MRIATKVLGCTALLSGLAGLASAPAAAEQSTFDVTVLAASCANCHGTDGKSPGSIPTIAGRPQTILHQKLTAFQSDSPPAETTVMDRLMKGLSDEQIAALAQHFSQITLSQSSPEVSKP